MSTNRDDDFRGTDRFDVQRRFGSGGMGTVYLASDRPSVGCFTIAMKPYVDNMRHGTRRL